MAGLGTYRSTDAGAIFTTGGKKNRTVAFSVSTAEIERFARKGGDELKKMVKKAEGRAASGCRAQVRKIMKVGGGLYGVPKFRPYDPFTLELHPSWTKRRIGGMLAESGSIVMFKRGGVQYIGWPDYLGEIADKFQEGRGGSSAEKMFTDKDYRQTLHRRGIKDIPRSYTHNPRQVLSVYKDNLDRNLSEFKNGVLKKMIATELYKAARAAKGAA